MVYSITQSHISYRGKTYRYSHKAHMSKWPSPVVPDAGHTGAEYSGAGDASYVSVDTQRL